MIATGVRENGEREVLGFVLGAAQEAGVRLAFLYYYQVLEYAAFYYIEDQVRLNLARVLRRPDIVSSADTCLSMILDQLTDYRQSDEQKLSSVVQRAADPTRVWGVVSQYAAFFGEGQQFEGGFSLPPLVNAEWIAQDFTTAWIPKLPDSLRKIRNALVHSRESRLGHVISPTDANSERIFPWLKVIEETACQVALNWNI